VEPNTGPDVKSRLYQMVQAHKSWNAFWLEATDPPTKPIRDSNVTMLMLANGGSASRSSFGFLMASSRQPDKKQKDRQRECARDVLGQVEQLTQGKSEGDLRAWYQVPAVDESLEPEAERTALEKLKSTMESRLVATAGKSSGADPVVEVEFPEPQSCVICGLTDYGGSEDSTKDPDISVLDFFEPDSVDLFKEAKRLGGLVRLRWYLAVVKASRKATSPAQEGLYRPLSLGMGFATDQKIAKARALRAAEVRAEVLTEAMFLKPPQKDGKT